MSKLTRVQDAVAKIADGSTLAIGGNVLHRAPMAIVREIARQNKQGLKLVKTAGAMDIDLLCLAGCAQSVDAGFVSYESEFGLAQNYRKSVESGRVKANEHACYTVICALRAASVGADFMPVVGLVGSELIEKNDYFAIVKSPFSEKPHTVVKAIKPDYVIIHVQEADKNGNARIHLPIFEDVLLSKTGAKIIISTEKIVPETFFMYAKQKAEIPGFLVDSVIHCPNGASPCSVPEVYDINKKEIKRFKDITDKAGLEEYLYDKQREDYKFN